MAVCNFYLRGQCKFGDKCRNEHPPNRGPGFGNQSWNSNNNNVTLPFTADTMTSDLTPQSDKPLWPLSSYGAAKHEPTLLKDLDESPEELRVRAVAAIQAGNVNEYMTYENNKIAAAETVYSNARGNIKEAFEQAGKQSSLSALFATQSTGANTNSATFGGGSSSTPSAFGQPAFGQSTFGQQATSTCLLLHKPSAFGQPTTTTPSAFGQPAQPAPAFGQTTQPTSVFGQAPQAQSAFGQPQQPSAFGQTSQPSSLIKPATGAFGGLTGSGTTNAFGGGGFSAFSGQPSAFGAGATATAAAPVPQAGGSVFGQSAFGAAAAPSTTTAQTSVFAPATTSAFGAPSAFGALAPQQPVSAFGGSAFGSQTQTQPVSAFNTQTNNSFANLANAATSAFAGSTSAFGGGSSTASLDAPKVASAFSAQPLSAFPMSSPSSSSSFPAANSNANNGKGRSVVGPPDFASAKSCYQPGATPYDQQLPPNYMGAVLPPSVLDAFKAQKFEWGKIPEWVPPLELR